MPSLATFTPPRAPDISASAEEQPDLYVVRFGDGYSQRSPKGINSTAAVVQLTWSTINETDKTTLISFFQTKGGYVGFYYTLPGEASARKWRAPRWSWQALTYDAYTVSATLEQIFDPDP